MATWGRTLFLFLFTVRSKCSQRRVKGSLDFEFWLRYQFIPSLKQKSPQLFIHSFNWSNLKNYMTSVCFSLLKSFLSLQTWLWLLSCSSIWHLLILMLENFKVKCTYSLEESQFRGQHMYSWWFLHFWKTEWLRKGSYGFNPLISQAEHLSVCSFIMLEWIDRASPPPCQRGAGLAISRMHCWYKALIILSEHCVVMKRTKYPFVARLQMFPFPVHKNIFHLWLGN